VPGTKSYLFDETKRPTELDKYSDGDTISRPPVLRMTVYPATAYAVRLAGSLISKQF